jgi:hypothetical protein
VSSNFLNKLHMQCGRALRTEGRGVVIVVILFQWTRDKVKNGRGRLRHVERDHTRENQWEDRL